MVSKGRELAKNTAIISIGKICTQVVSFLLLPVYTSILSTEEYGIIDLIITYSSLLLPIVTLQLEQALFRFLIETRNEEAGIKDVLSTICSMNIVFFLMFMVVYLIVAPFIDSQYKYFLLLKLISSVFSSIMLQIARGLGKNTVYAVGSFLSASLVVILNVIFIVFLQMGVTGIVLAHFVSGIVSGVYIFIKVSAYKYIRFMIPNREKAKKYLEYSLPLIPNQLSWWILSASDRTVILAQMGVAFNGIYSIATKFSGLYSVMYNIFNLSWTEMVSMHFNDEDREKSFCELQDMIVRILMSVYLMIIAVMPFAFPIMIDDKYRDAYYQIPILMVGVFFSAMIGVLSAYYIADKNTKAIAKTTMLCAVINLVLDIVLMPFIGLFAASIASAIAYCTMYVVRYRDINKRYGVKNSSKLLIMMFVATMIIMIVYYSKNVFLHFIGLVAISTFSIIINRNIVKSAFVLIREKLKWRG